MKTPEELLREFASHTAGLAEYAAPLQQQSAPTQEQLALATVQHLNHDKADA